jgi:predicted MPP superfamily phosphohydrolase
VNGFPSRAAYNTAVLSRQFIPPFSLARRHPRVTGVLLAAGLFLGGWAFWWEPGRLIVHHESLAIRGLPAMKIALIADLHIGGPHVKLDAVRRVVDRVNEENPDLVVLLGDYISESLGGHRHIIGVLGGHYIDPKLFAPILGGMHSAHGIYGVLGNHDWKFQPDILIGDMEQSGIHLLTNDAVKLTVYGQSFWLVCAGDAHSNRADLKRAFRDVPDGEPALVITHSPDIFPDLPDNARLLLAGHTHGGQVSFPFIGPITADSIYGMKYVRGHVHEFGRDIWVTSGVGTTGLPVRFRVPPEVLILTVNPVK